MKHLHAFRWALLFAFLAAKASTEVWPGISSAIAWIILGALIFAGIMIPLARRSAVHAVAVAILAAGALCNFSVVLANGGLMPVSGAVVEKPAHHVQATGYERLLFLADVHGDGNGAHSFGDVLLVIAMAALLGPCMLLSAARRCRARRITYESAGS